MTRGMTSAERLLAFAGLLAIGGLPTFVITITLFAIAVSFIGSGIGVFVAGVLTLSGALPPEMQMRDSPVIAIVIGPILLGAGVTAAAALVFYFWLATKAVR